ncbi:hypothetical protein AUJ62_01845 [Candidatus Pacearchaeota archaeon CG1_02_32_21]|nr:MAG: hypothetical protein AUJ62_01845 [Candidatus Pacearchaeota archaeon CG1_02_32_21]
MGMQKEIDNRLINIAVDRLVREIQTKSGIAPVMYLAGYKEAICDILWDYAKTGLKSLDWEDYMAEQERLGHVRRGTIALKDIKKIEKGGEKKNEV